MHLPPLLTTDDPTELPPGAVATARGPMHGSWAAVRWEYAPRSGGAAVDLIAGLGAAVTLSMSDAEYVLSFALRGGRTRTAAGALRVSGDEWIDFSPRGGVPERVEFRRAAGTLVLRSESSAWDFAGTGEEPAAFTAVLVRL